MPLTSANARKLYFVPIGTAPLSEINLLVSHYQDKFGIESQVLRPMAVNDSDVNMVRRQLIAENLIDSMLRTYSQYAADKSSIMIGITGDDMYPLGERWDFCFGWRIVEKRAAVVSTARMDLHYPQEPPSEALLSTRLRKMVTKDIGILYFGKLPSANPKSVLYNRILGLDQLDQVTEDF